MINYSDYNVILASKSPRRHELMSKLDIPFTVAPDFDVPEILPDDVRKKDAAVYLANKKSEAYPFTLESKDILIAADTTVLCNDRLMGKPENRKDALEMLNFLSGKTHEVITGVCVRTVNEKVLFDDTAYVTFSDILREEAEYYVDKFEPYDKAGAYGIQDRIGYIAVEKINGSFFNIMGLPVHRLYYELIKIMTRNNLEM